jgi:hypothetical protein
VIFCPVVSSLPEAVNEALRIGISRIFTVDIAASAMDVTIHDIFNFFKVLNDAENNSLQQFYRNMFSKINKSHKTL